jgi:hypothetical protein
MYINMTSKRWGMFLSCFICMIYPRMHSHLHDFSMRRHLNISSPVDHWHTDMNMGMKLNTNMNMDTDMNMEINMYIYKKIKIEMDMNKDKGTDTDTDKDKDRKSNSVHVMSWYCLYVHLHENIQ